MPTLQFVRGLCFGVLRIKPNEIDEWDLSDIWAAYLGYWSIEQLKQRTQWEIGRMIAFYTVAPHSKKGKLNKFSDIMPFEWDAKTESKKWTKADVERLKASGNPMFQENRKDGRK